MPRLPKLLRHFVLKAILTMRVSKPAATSLCVVRKERANARERSGYHVELAFK